MNYKSIDYRLTSGVREDVGPGTACRPIGGGCASPARPLSITVSYSVYIKATGNLPPAGGRINNTGSYSVFQVDGVGGLNNNANQNFNTYISGLGNIRFISCNPIVTVSANNGRVVNFGSIPRQNAVVGKIEKQIPFAVSADMSGPDSGQDCQGQVLEASFSSVNPVRDTNTIMPTSDSGFGIQLSQQDTPGTYIPMNTPVNMGLINGSNVTKNFLASLRWLSTSPRVGPFTASANIDVTFK
ncbi:fimbrial protein [Pseudomonas sp. 5P_3.1_Bac2]|nr:fimbrial protein [Pseudomonas sp. 5P_3.1_Bac2]